VEFRCGGGTPICVSLFRGHYGASSPAQPLVCICDVTGWRVRPRTEGETVANQRGRETRAHGGVGLLCKHRDTTNTNRVCLCGRMLIYSSDSRLAPQFSVRRLIRGGCIERVTILQAARLRVPFPNYSVCFEMTQSLRLNRTLSWGQRAVDQRVRLTT
jgi:hypothetical protein